MLTITEKAEKMLRERGAGSDNFLRIGVKTGGCAGMTYDAEIDSQMNPDEKVIQTHNGIDVVTSIGSIPYLLGLVIDYQHPRSLCWAVNQFTASTNSRWPRPAGWLKMIRNHLQKYMKYSTRLKPP